MREFIDQFVFESAGLGIVVVNDAHRIVEMNGVFEKMLGYSREELLGMSVANISVTDTLPDNLLMFEELKNGERSSYQLEKRYVTRSGAHIWAKVTGTLLPPGDGNHYVLGLVEDITEQKRAERMLSESEARFRQIITSIYDWVWEIGVDGRFNFSSDKVECLLGYTVNEVIGKRPTDLVHADQVVYLRELFAEISRQRKAFTRMQVVNRHKDGKKILLEISGVPVYTAEGEFLGFRGVAHDVTQQAKLEQELAQASKLKTIAQLAGGIAHDFNNALHVVLGNLKLLLEDPSLPQGADAMIGNAISAGERASMLTRQLLSFSRKQTLNPALLDPASALNRFLDSIERVLPQSIELRVEVQGEPGCVNIDLAGFESAILNLVLNSRDAMPEGGEIRISLAPHTGATSTGGDREVEIVVQDQGHGIAEEDLDYVFDPFFTRKAIGDGSGLGLSMVYGFVKQSGGRIEITSQVGRGTRVSIFFPEVIANAAAGQLADTTNRAG